MSLDLSKLSHVKPCADGWVAQCPVCARTGHDNAGKNHLKVWRTGAYSCAVHPGDDAHNKAIFAIAGVGGSGEVTLEAAPPARQIELPKSWPVDVLDGLVKDHSYWNGRGISDFTVAPFKGGVATRGQMKGRYVFPIFDPLNDDKVIGFAGRRVDGGTEMPWKFIGSKSLFVWGDVDEISSSHRVTLVESVGDGLALIENGIRDVLVLFGVTMSQQVLATIIKLNPSSIIIATNNDTKHDVGQQAAHKIETTLRKFFFEDVIRVCFPIAKDFGEMTDDQFSEWKTKIDT